MMTDAGKLKTSSSYFRPSEAGDVRRRGDNPRRAQPPSNSASSGPNGSNHRIRSPKVTNNAGFSGTGTGDGDGPGGWGGNYGGGGGGSDNDSDRSRGSDHEPDRLETDEYESFKIPYQLSQFMDPYQLYQFMIDSKKEKKRNKSPLPKPPAPYAILRTLERQWQDIQNRRQKYNNEFKDQLIRQLAMQSSRAPLRLDNGSEVFKNQDIRSGVKEADKRLSSYLDDALLSYILEQSGDFGNEPAVISAHKKAEIIDAFRSAVKNAVQQEFIDDLDLLKRQGDVIVVLSKAMMPIKFEPLNAMELRRMGWIKGENGSYWRYKEVSMDDDKTEATEENGEKPEKPIVKIGMDGKFLGLRTPSDDSCEEVVRTYEGLMKVGVV